MTHVNYHGINFKKGDQIFLLFSSILRDENRFENPDKIRRDIKQGIKNKKVVEISNRATAISEAIKNLSTGEILLVAGRGHEKIQDF